MNVRSVRLLTDRLEDRSTWLGAWERYGREPFAHPDYAPTFCGPTDQACCALVETPHGEAMIPLVLRTIEDELTPHDLRDATSPYGYGGPFGESAQAIAASWSVLGEWMADEDIVSMFGRLSLDSTPPKPLPPSLSVRTNADNVVVDLTRSDDAQWRHYDHKVRKNVNKALRAGLVARVAERFTDLAEFAALYAATMERRGAAEWYRFDVDVFSRLTHQLDGSYLAAEVRDPQGTLVSAELVLTSERYLYSFLGGTLPSAFPYAPNDLLKHDVINAGRNSGRVGFVLGGGYASNDGIFRYKRAFDPTGVVPFRRVELVAEPAIYNVLAASRRAVLTSTSTNARLLEGFFPSYRAPLLRAAPPADSQAATQA